MHCPKCGCNGAGVIADGCVLAFAKQCLTGQLCLPTLPDNTSEVKEAVHPVSFAASSDMLSLSAGRMLPDCEA